jgi:hypothetical protein
MKMSTVLISTRVVRLLSTGPSGQSCKVVEGKQSDPLPRLRGSLRVQMYVTRMSLY